MTMKIHQTLVSVLTIILLSNTGFSQETPGYIPLNGLQGWWPFNGNANDESGNGTHGTVEGATLTNDRFDNAESAYFFNGSSDHIDLGNVFNNLEAFTFTGWINRSQQSSLYDEIFSKETCFSIAVDNGNNRMHINFGDGIQWSPANLALTSTVDIPLNTWTHIGVTRSWPDGTTRLYINGELDNTSDFPISGENMMPVQIGSKSSGAAPYFPGDIDDIGFWSTQLSDEEVYEIYLATETSVFNQAAPNFKLYPNPATTTLNIEQDFLSAGSILEIFDASGRLVKTITVQSPQQQIDVSGLSAGWYTIQPLGFEKKGNMRFLKAD